MWFTSNVSKPAHVHLFRSCVVKFYDLNFNAKVFCHISVTFWQNYFDPKIYVWPGGRHFDMFRRSKWFVFSYLRLCVRCAVTHSAWHPFDQNIFELCIFLKDASSKKGEAKTRPCIWSETVQRTVWSSTCLSEMHLIRHLDWVVPSGGVMY